MKSSEMQTISDDFHVPQIYHYFTKLLSKRKTSGKSGKRVTGSETEDNAFFSGKIAL